MKAPWWARALLSHLAAPDVIDEVVGDLEEAHRRRLARRSWAVATLLTSVETFDVAFALLRRRGLPSASLLDLKLSIRMLRKYPGLSVISVIGMMVAVSIGSVAFGMIRGWTRSTLPLDEGDRIVTVQNTVDFGLSQEAATHLHALEVWRTQVPSLSEVGAYRLVVRNLIDGDGGVSPSRVAEMTASGFRIARVPPQLGRYFSDEDEVPGGADVAVIGHGVWQDRFGGADDVVGRTIQVGATRHLIVGVMPEGFAFPLNERIWTPLRLRATDYPPGEAPPISVFARLAANATLGQANVQLRSVGRRNDLLQAASGRVVEPAAFPYTQEMFWGWAARILYLAQALVTMILVVIAINVSALVYARTVSRSDEISVRTALGASRQRIVAQLFTEALLLSGLAAAGGLFTAGMILDRIGMSVRAGRSSPFWWDFSLTPSALLYGFIAATLAATIIGVVPALGVTGRGLQQQLQHSGSGSSRPNLGRTWTTLIALQIAGTVAVLPMAFGGLIRIANLEPAETAMPLDEVLVAQVFFDLDPTGGSAKEVMDEWQQRYTARMGELTRRLSAWPQVARVAVMGVAPWRDPDVRFEMDGRAVGGLHGTVMESASTGHRVGRSVVAPEIFEVVDVPALKGRLLTSRDAVKGGTSIVVNDVFVDIVLKGGPAVGTRVRFPTPTSPELGNRSDVDGVGQPWYTVVGVVPSFPPPSGLANAEAKVYLPLTPEHRGEVTIALRSRAEDASELAAQVRSFVADVDPLLRLSGVEILETRHQRSNARYPVLVWVVVVVALSTLLLAVAGLYALMSFTVARRQREIGIRIALGAQRPSVLLSILLSATWQLAVGVLVGLLAAGIIDRFVGGEMLGRQGLLLLPGVGILMLLIGVLAAWVPAREALRIHPTQALRSD